MSLLCRIFGHRHRSVQSDQIVSFVSPDHWIWPGVVAFCPRCGKVYRGATSPTGPIIVKSGYENMASIIP